MIETVCTFGADEGLVGIVTEPEAEATGAPAVVVLNSGLLPRTGTFRLHVTMARALARLGFLVLRFDLAGIGDSQNHSDGRPHDEQVAGDIQDALDQLSDAHQCDRFVLMGICTGADNAHKAAVADPRVVGAVFVDGYAYRTAGYFIRRYLPSLLKPTSVLNRLQSIPRLLSKTNAEGPSDGEGDVLGNGWDLPPKGKTEGDLLSLVKRNVQLLYFFCGTNRDFQYANQFRDAFPAIDFQDRLQVCHLREAPHTFMFMKSRDQFIDTLCAWMTSRFS